MEAPMTITPELRLALERSGAAPVRIEDPESKRVYVVITAEQFERVRTHLGDDPVDEMAPFLDETFAEGWDDPTLDVYNRRQS
jgi:hypothetical protein